MRYYDAATARWLGVDPLAELYESWSPYNYVLNNPLAFGDPSGLCPEGYGHGEVWNDPENGPVTCYMEDTDGAQVEDSYIPGYIVEEYGWFTRIMGPPEQRIPSEWTWADGRHYYSYPVDASEIRGGGLENIPIGPGSVKSASLLPRLLKGRNILGTVKWSSGVVSRAAYILRSGKKFVTVSNRSQAEELFLGLYVGKGFVNTTGMSGSAVRSFFTNGKYGTYHWDEAIDASGRVGGHGAGNIHGSMPHLQIHDEAGNIIHIFYKN
jgi:hypothetical protein